MIQLRTATPATIDAFIAEAARHFFGGSAASIRRSLGELDEDTSFILADAQADLGTVATATIRWRSDYPPFRERGIPLIQNIEVRSDLRRRGYGTNVMAALEQLVAQRASAVGICVGLFDAYGPAQRLYARRGFLPDGRGACDQHTPLSEGQAITLHHGHLLWLVKDLTP